MRGLSTTEKIIGGLLLASGILGWGHLGERKSMELLEKQTLVVKEVRNEVDNSNPWAVTEYYGLDTDLNGRVDYIQVINRRIPASVRFPSKISYRIGPSHHQYLKAYAVLQNPAIPEREFLTIPHRRSTE